MIFPPALPVIARESSTEAIPFPFRVIARESSTAAISLRSHVIARESSTEAIPFPFRVIARESSTAAISPLFLTALIYITFSVLFSCTYAQNPDQSLINASGITSWVGEDGFHAAAIQNNIFSYAQFNGSYPNALPVGVLYTEGINWGGMVYDGQPQLIRVNGNNYGSGCKAHSRPFRVRTDYNKADLTNDAAGYYMKDPKDVTGGELAVLRGQYQTDWDEWPADKGAPYYDVDKDGTYNPDIDIPGVPGALQTLWINYSDEGSFPLYSADPIGLDITETYWVYGADGRIGNIIYKKVDIIYRGTAGAPPSSHIDSMYICQFTDADIGYQADDFIGTDTTLNLAYTYNSHDSDLVYSYYNIVPPSAGNVFIQGVSYRTGNSSDSAVFNFKWEKGRKYFNRKPLTNSILHRIGGYFTVPWYSYTGALEFYNLMCGYMPDPPYPSRRKAAEFIGYGTYMLPGDPVTGTGDIDGVRDSPGARSCWLMNGPFNMALGDTAEIVEALVAGIGENYLGSVSVMKHNTADAVDFYNSFVEEMTGGNINITLPGGTHPVYTPANYVLYQNYPNPFNSFTTIRYELPEQAHVKLTIYDILGREVANLVNEEKPAGQYSVKFDAGKLSNGVYIYRINFDNQSNREVFDGLHKTMKFILVK